MSLKILQSTLRKLKECPDKLALYNNVFEEQKTLGMIEKVENLDDFISKNKMCSFMPHMGVYKLNRETTKCRVVFLANLAENNPSKPITVSHNMAILPGPCLNATISTAIIHLRFDKYVLTFDIVKAFLNIKLCEHDSNRLMFLWFKNVGKKDYEIIAYRSIRLSFGLRCSPSVLMMGLYIMLIHDQQDDQETNDLKRLVYHNIYMDNGAYTSSDPDKIMWAYKKLIVVFARYKFDLQQFNTNVDFVQSYIDTETDTPSTETIKLFGMNWNKNKDTLSPFAPKLDIMANTKRAILRSLNAIYDIYNIYVPVVLRAKLYMQKLQSDPNLKWDTVLSDSLLKEWLNICKQTNLTPPIEIDRFIGARGSSYTLVCFTDASAVACGCTIYIKDNTTNKVSYITSQCKLLNNALRKKSIPTLECYAIHLGAEALIATRKSLCSDSTVVSIDINKMYLLTDSKVCLYWIESNSIKFDKLQNLSILVRNKLRKIDELSRIFPITFGHVAGKENPSDFCTKPCSPKILARSNFHYGPEFLSEDLTLELGDGQIFLPNPNVLPVDEVSNIDFIQNFSLQDEATNAVIPVCSVLGEDCGIEDTGNEGTAVSPRSTTMVDSGIAISKLNPSLIPIERYSDFNKLVKVYSIVFRFVNKLKSLVSLRTGKVFDLHPPDQNYHVFALKILIRAEQQIHFSEVFAYFKSKGMTSKVPDILLRMNLYLDKDCILRVRSKFNEIADEKTPIMLPKLSHLTSLIIRHIHVKLQHAGLYNVTRELKRQFYLEGCFTVVRKMIRDCIVCKRFNNLPVKLNQGFYRDFRVNPDSRPFSNVMMDHLGPFKVKLNNGNTKVWILIVTCLFTRAINLKVCYSLDTDEFLRAVQVHIYEYGIFSLCISDLGSQLVSGANIIQTFLSESDTQSFLESNGIRSIKFQNYPKGNSSLGSLVETLVKQVKHLISKSIRNSILPNRDFEFLVSKAVCIINKRPIAVKEALSATPNEEFPGVITPELLIRGYDTCSVNIIPSLQGTDDEDISDNYGATHVKESYQLLQKVRNRLMEIYHSEFLGTLINQALDKPERYKKQPHHPIIPGDIVLLVDKFSKRNTYPLGKVMSIEQNDLGETTAARVLKGSSRETVYRHSSSLIPLLQSKFSTPDVLEDEVPKARPEVQVKNSRPSRESKNVARARMQSMIANGLA